MKGNIKIVFFSPLLVATAITLLKHAGGSKEIYVVFDQYNCYPSNHAYSSWQDVYSPVLTKADDSEPSLSLYLSFSLVFVFVRVVCNRVIWIID
jgi:hypothetical protein